MPARRSEDAEERSRRDRQRRSDVARRRERQPVRVPADNVYALLERLSRRESVAARGGGRACALCGRAFPSEQLTVDHTVARALGGADSPDNLQAACVRCNNLKSRLEAAVQARRQRGSAVTGVAASVLAAIANATERERFAAHPSVHSLLEALREAEQSA